MHGNGSNCLQARHHLSIRPPDGPLPETLVATLDQTNAAFYPGIYVVVKTLLVYPISACAVIT